MRNQGWNQVKMEWQKEAIPSLQQNAEKTSQPAEAPQSKPTTDVLTAVPTLAVQS